MFGSDNVSCIASHNSIPHVHHLIQQMQGITVTKWTCPEASAGKNGLYTHLSFVNMKLKSHVMKGNNFITDEGMRDDISFQGGISGTTSILFDGDTVQGPVLIFNKELKYS